MDKPGNKETRRTGYKNFFNIILFGASIVIVVLIFPLEGKFRYEFQKGKPWLHETLIAPWDFPVRKPEAELKRERDSITASFAPYYVFDSLITGYALSEFDKYLNRIVMPGEKYHGQEIPSYRLASIKSALMGKAKGIYASGILEPSDVTDALVHNNGRITIVRSKVARESSLDRIYTQKDAYQAVNVFRNELAEEMERAGRISEAEFLRSVMLYEYIKPNLIYSEETSSILLDRLIRSVSPSRGLIQERELIINRGQIVDGNKYQILESLKMEYEKRLGKYGSWLIILGRFIIISACYLVLYLFLFNFRPEVLGSVHKTLFIILVILLFVFLTRLVSLMPNVSVYLIPFGIIPILVRTFYDSRLALFILLVTIMIAGFLVPNSFEFIFTTFIGGVVAIFSLTNIYRRGRLFFSAVMVVISYSTVFFGMSIIQEGSFSGIDWNRYGWFAGNGFLLLLSYPMIFLFEKTFGFLSDATLFELSDTNQPLLRRLAEEAPGSFQHSLQVASLAEEAARAIGANHLLVRTGALYHDIGKLNKSELYAENIARGFNPHSDIAPEESARLIIEHVDKGVELARKNNLPVQIIDFIRTHQGTTRAFFFYHKYSEAHPGERIDESLFTYPGPKPFSRETAVLMMSDSVEAASRSLEVYSKESVGRMVDTVIENQISDGQFTDAPITFRDISVIKEVFKRRLINIYHARISYPERK